MNLVKKLKDHGEDFEWYSSTKEIIKRMYKHLSQDFSHQFSLLDVGAGNGKVFSVLDELIKKSAIDHHILKYAIEKSTILVESMDSDIFVIGSNFYEQTLIDKKVDAIFSNPPYSEFEQWAEKIINESNSKYIYLVLPQRWKDSLLLQNSIKKRNAKYKIIGNFDFENAERQARAKVNLIKIFMQESSEEHDPFDIWFDEHYTLFDRAEEDLSDHERDEEKRQEIREVVAKGDIISNLEKMYRLDLKNLQNNYKALEKIDVSLFKELNIKVSDIKENLKLKISGLKNIYWKELFNNLEVMTNRLTHRSREKLLNTLMQNTTVDFNASNVYNVVIWAIKNANKYFDKQLLDLYLDLSSRDNIRLYKSNKRLIEDGWRYDKRDMSHYSLDYRIVHHFHNAIEYDWSGYEKGLTSYAADFIQDVLTIAINLNFDVSKDIDSVNWSAGKKVKFYYGGGKLFAVIKAFKNGNLHFNFVPEFMKKMNVEAARLNGWIKSPKEAAEEFDVSLAEATEMFGSNMVLLKNNLVLLN